MGSELTVKQRSIVSSRCMDVVDSVREEYGLKVVEGEDDTGDHLLLVFCDDKLVLEWTDLAVCDYPEDLAWFREISNIFYSGVEAGKMLARKEQK